MKNDDLFPDQDPRPDEDAWEAYLTFVVPLLGASQDNGINNAQLRSLETALGTSLPFEIGLLLVMGTPGVFPWRQWDADPEQQLLDWDAEVAGCVNVPVDELANAPKLLPIFGNIAVPVSMGDGESSADANPLFRIEPNGVHLAGLDLADWLHKQFDMPLPWWPENHQRTFPFWTERLTNPS